ncbi:elongator complex protein 6 isoform X2 [Anabrus simplex]
MAALLLGALGVDKEDLVSKLLVVEEHHGSDANFVLTSLMIQRLQKDGGVCLMTLHNTISHYQNVVMKMSGCNLLLLQGKGFVQTFDCLKELSAGLMNDAGNHFLLNHKECVAKTMFLMLKEKVELLCAKRSSVCIVIDDLSDLLAIGVPLSDVLSFFHYCRTLLLSLPELSLIVLSHVVEEDEQQSLLAAGLAHVADVFVTVSALKTGHSSDVSGVLKVRHKNTESVSSQSWNQQNSFQYKLQDRQVKVFAPGTAPSLQ